MYCTKSVCSACCYVDVAELIGSTGVSLTSVLQIYLMKNNLKC